MDDRPIASDAYDELAAAYAARADTKPHNAYYDRPALVSLLPVVQGRRILDAGCGPGWYSEWLLDHGAEHVVSMDASQAMVHQARMRLQRFGDRSQVIEADINSGLGLASADRHLVISGLALHYIRDWHALFQGFFGLLQRGGHVVFSIEHPWVQWNDHNRGNYFDVERVEYTWRGFGTPVVVPSYRRSLQDVMNPLLDAGFLLEKVLEPRPTVEFQAVAPADYEELNRSPGFLCVRARVP